MGGEPEVEKSLFLSSCPGGHLLIVIQTGKNLGYAGGNNAGIRYALSRGDCGYVWLLNNDTVVAPDALTRMVRMAGADDNTGLVGSKILYADRPGIIQAAGGGKIVPCIGNTSLVANLDENRGQWDRPMKIDYVTGASLLIRSKVLTDVGLFDERYFLYWEDADIAVRAKRKGYNSVYCPESRVWHKEGGTSGGINPLTDYYWTRNGLAFIKKFYPAFLPLVPIAYLAKYTIVRILRRQSLNFLAFIRGVRDFCAGRTGK
jgi:GT2 family glycosyltransferase